jgi:hypothetical protein
MVTSGAEAYPDPPFVMLMTATEPPVVEKALLTGVRNAGSVSVTVTPVAAPLPAFTTESV